MQRSRVALEELVVDSFVTTPNAEPAAADDGKMVSCTGFRCSLCCVEPTCTDCPAC